MPLGPEGNRPSGRFFAEANAYAGDAAGRLALAASGGYSAPRSEEDDMAGPDLRFIGERLDRIQTELRELRALKTDATPLAERTGRLESKLDHVASKVETLDAKVGALDAKVDAVDRWLGARMDQFAAQAATNLLIVLAALPDKPVKRRLRSC